MKKIITSIAVVMGLGSAPAFAQTGWYMGLGAGVGSLNASGQDLTGLPDAQLDDTDTTYTVRGGWRFNPNIAVELGYYDLGKYGFSGSVGSAVLTGSAKAKSYGIFARRHCAAQPRTSISTPASASRNRRSR